MTRAEVRLIQKVNHALEQQRKGDPLKDFIDDHEVVEALELLVKMADPNT